MCPLLLEGHDYLEEILFNHFMIKFEAYEIKHVWYHKPSQKLMAVGIQNPGRKDTAEVLLSEHVV